MGYGRRRQRAVTAIVFEATVSAYPPLTGGSGGVAES